MMSRRASSGTSSRGVFRMPSVESQAVRPEADEFHSEDPYEAPAPAAPLPSHRASTGNPTRGVFHSNTADSVELRAARPSDNRLGSRRRAAAPEEEYEEEEEVPLTSKAGNSTPMPIDYGYDDHDTSLELTAQMLNLENDVFMGPKTRRGSTGIMPVQYTIPEAAVPKINRRASTGQEYRNEMCPPTPPTPSNRMGRRGSAGSIMTNRSELSYLVNYSPSVASHVELRETQQMVYGSYFPKKTHRENSDSEEDADYITAYGYGQAQGGNRDSMVGRRGNDFSLASRSSSTKQNAFLRSSKGKELQQTAALMGGSQHSAKKTAPQNAEDSEEESTICGYSEKDGSHRELSENDSESVSESDYSQASSRSRRSTRSARRSSVVILPDKKKTGMSLLSPQRTSIRMLGGDNSINDENEIDDYLSNSAYLDYVTSSNQPGESAILDSDGKRIGAMQTPRNETNAPKPTHTLKSKEDSWGRATPFTTPHASLTKEALEDSLKSNGIPVEHSMNKISTHGNWGGIKTPSSAESSSDGGELYKDSTTLAELDRYNQRPRRRDSIDRTCIDMGALLETQTKDKKVPKFKPAVNCSNASDYVVRAFVARLRLGMPVIKHNRSRWSKSQQRELILLPDGKTLSWKPVEGETDKGKRPKLDLLKCIEVRHAWSKDPDTRKKLGTGVLRSKCKDGSASKSFSLIFNKRTLDITAMTTDTCKLMMEGFSALCFRLQMEKMCEEEQDRVEGVESGSASNCNEGSRSMIGDDDWASTVYGESTASMTQSNTMTSATNSPWGL